MTHTLHLDPTTPNLAEYNAEGGCGHWTIPVGKDIAGDVERWRAAAELVARHHGYDVAEWHAKPAGGHRAVLRPSAPADVDTVRAAVAAAVSGLGLAVASVTAEAASGRMWIELA